MIPPDWLNKADTISSPAENLELARQHYQAALQQYRSNPDDAAKQSDLLQAAQHYHETAVHAQEAHLQKMTRKKSWTPEDWKEFFNAPVEPDAISDTWNKKNLEPQDLQKLVGPDLEAQVAQAIKRDLGQLSAATTQPSIPQETSAKGRKITDLEEQIHDLQLTISVLWEYRDKSKLGAQTDLREYLLRNADVRRKDTSLERLLRAAINSRKTDK